MGGLIGIEGGDSIHHHSLSVGLYCANIGVIPLATERPLNALYSDFEMPAVTRTQTKKSVRATRSQSTEDQTIEWQYRGKEESFHGLQSAKQGDDVYDDCKIPLPNARSRFKRDNYFRLVKVTSDGFLLGVFKYKEEIYPHKRPSTHI